MQRSVLGFAALWALAAASGLGGCTTTAHDAVVSNSKTVPLWSDETKSTELTAERLVRLRDIAGLTLSPDGRNAIFQIRKADPETNDYSLAWYVLKLGGNKTLTHIAAGGDPIQPKYLGRINGEIETPEPVWSADGEWVVYVRKDEGRLHLWRAHRSGNTEEQLSQADGDVLRFAFSDDGQHVILETQPSKEQIATRLAKEGLSGYLYDRRFIPSYATRPLLPRDLNFSFGKDLTSQIERDRRRVWAIDISSKEHRIATDEERDELVRLTEAARPDGREAWRWRTVEGDGGAAIWTEALDPEAQGGLAPETIIARSTSMGTPVVCQHTACTSQLIRDFWWMGTDTVLFASAEGDNYETTAFYAWRLSDRSLRLIYRTTEDQASSKWNCIQTTSQLICIYEDAVTPNRIVSIDVSTGELVTLFDPNPDIAEMDLRDRVTRIEFSDGPGANAFGYLVMPNGHQPGERSPLIIVTYRCSGFLRGATGDEYPIYPFANHGLAVLCFDAPIDYDMLRTMDWNAYNLWAHGPGHAQRKAVQAALDVFVSELDDRGVIDASRVGLTGLSFGAEIVSYALFNMPHLKTAIASGVGAEPSNLFLNGEVTANMLEGWGLTRSSEQRWDAIALSRNVDKVLASTLINVSDHEFISTLEGITALESADRPVEVFVYPDEYHIKSQPAHRSAIYKRNIDWMNFWLRDIEDPNPAKTEQYERWRALRKLHSSYLVDDSRQQ